ncbi:hypothetical protein B0H10DRAFT_2021817 [Mycena sp. CBHHK59/15]|nr:hypothetical protein B0H10DRAFT_2021817 [Mycena sp. CBHHK59/15]
MDKRLGQEGLYGIGGGGIVSEESQRNLEIAEDLCRRGRPNDAVPFLHIALEDKNNFDAEIQMAYLSPDLHFSVRVLEVSERRARALLKQHLGADCFDDDGPCVGQFGVILLTRPYMRVLQALARMCYETKQYEKAVPLCQRFWLGPLLLRVARPADALSFCQTWLHIGEVGGAPPPRGGTLFAAPSRTLLAPEHEERFARAAASDLAHTAALAAFRLWGPCAQAAQYLRIGVRTNPAILVKVIGRRARPESGNMNPRGFNGPEEAHDYLWIAQDLWEEPDVWSWIQEDSTVSEEVLKGCSRPECSAEETKATQFKRCAACRQVVFSIPIHLKLHFAYQRIRTGDCVAHVQMQKNLRNVFTHKPTTIPTYTLDGGLLRTI